MKQSEIEIGGRYTAKVSGKIVVVRVDNIRIVGTAPSGRFYNYAGAYHGETTVYDVTNESTGRKLTFRSARKFRTRATFTATVKIDGPFCDNCGKRSNVACAKCNRNICEDCYHCGAMGKTCGLCIDRERSKEE